MSQVGPPLTELTDVLQALFEDLRQTSLAGESLSEIQYSSLSTLFGKRLLESLGYMENKQVTCYSSRNSDIRVYIVETFSSKQPPTPYKVFPYHYCECKSFVFDVMQKKKRNENQKKAIFCKHMLATWLANALDKCVQVEVDDDELKRMLRKQC